jgi:hypothetical protein
MFMFEHPACSDIVVDVHITLPELNESIDILADRYRPACPICKQPTRYAGWNFSDEDTTVGKRNHHAPIVGLHPHQPHITGCACGWKTPPRTSDSDSAYAEHYAICCGTEQP